MRKGQMRNARVLFEPCGVISDEIARFELADRPFGPARLL